MKERRRERKGKERSTRFHRFNVTLLKSCNSIFFYAIAYPLKGPMKLASTGARKRVSILILEQL